MTDRSFQHHHYVSQADAMKTTAVLSMLSITMFASLARSFTTQSVKLTGRSSGAAARWMSAPTGVDGPTIVDTCRQKIAVALETEDVKVTGELGGISVWKTMVLAGVEVY